MHAEHSAMHGKSINTYKYTNYFTNHVAAMSLLSSLPLPRFKNGVGRHPTVSTKRRAAAVASGFTPWQCHVAAS